MNQRSTGWRATGLALAWLAGIAWHLQQRELPASSMVIGMLVIGVAGVLVAIKWRRAFVGALIGVALAAVGLADWRADIRLADALPASIEGPDVIVTGVVASLPQRAPSGLRFRFAVESATLANQPIHLPQMLALGWYKGFHEDAVLTQPQSELRAGQRWRFTLRLRQPHGNLNPQGFDYELALFEQGLRATGYVRDGPNARLDDAAGYPIERLRQRVRDAIYASVSDRRAAGVLAALAIGDQSAIEREDWDLYRNTGIAHVMSISGLHVTMFAWLAGLGLAALWRRSERAMLWLPVPLAARWGGIAAAAAYALFSGWGVPSQRTVWMLATVALLQSLGVRWPWMLVLLVAAVVVTALDPWALTQAGFWLSFAAVGLLMASSPSFEHAVPVASAPGWRGWPHRLLATMRGGLRTQLIATLGLTPLTLVIFQQVSIVGVAANLIAIPLVTLVITPLALAGVVLVPLWSLGGWVVTQFGVFLAWLAAMPGAVWMVPVAPAWAQLAGLVGAALLIMPMPSRARLLALPLLLPLLMPPRDLPAEGRFELLAMDVGQGTAVLVRTRAHVLVFDAGPQYSSDSDAGQRVLLPLLRARGDTHIDRLVLSHRDLDHVGGARSVMAALEVDDLYSSLEAGHPLVALASSPTRCAAGQSWVWDGVRFEMLRPAVADYDRALKSNAMSCVLRVSGSAGPRHSVLLTGDIEREQEAALVEAATSNDAITLAADLLIAPHHGSKTSSSAAFLDAVHPKVAIFQSGYRNRFGHPAPEVLARYRERGITIRTSPACGAWWWPADDSSAQGVCQRDVARRYWHHGEAN